MINSSRLYSCLIILITLSPNLFGQSDYKEGFIVTNEKDTIQGMVNYRPNSRNFESCIFKTGQEEKVYYPFQILGFGYDGNKYFTSQIIEGVFVEVLVVGPISLYKSEDKFHIKKDTSTYDLEKKEEKVEVNGKIGVVDRGKWRGIVNLLTSDCLKNSNNTIANLKLNEKSLTKIVVNYNKCRGTTYTEVKSNQPWTKFVFGASIGASLTKIQTQDNSGFFTYLNDTYSSWDPTLGVIIELSSPRVSDYIAFQAELHYMKSSFSSLVKLGNTITEYHDTYIDLSTLSLPVSFKYSFPQKKYGLYVQAGLNYDYHLNASSKVLSEQVIRNTVSTSPERLAFRVNDSQIGYWGGVGILRSFSGYEGSIAVRYFQMSSLNKDEGLSTNQNRISLNLILFKK